MNDGGESATATCKGYAMFSIFDGSDTLLKCCPCWVSQASIEMFAMGFDLLLNKSGAHVDWNIDTSVNFLRFLTDMDGHGGESFMLHREKVFFQESFELNFRFSFAVDHCLD